MPIGLTSDSTVFVSFYGTGIRNRSSLAGVIVKINGTSLPVLYAGPSPNFSGLDQVNVSLMPALAGAKEANVTMIVDGQTANTVTINIQ